MSVCRVPGCYNRYTTGGPFKFYRIPIGVRPFHSNRRRLWLQAIRRDDWDENIIQNARICSAHFISGKVSYDYRSLDFVPSVFPDRNNTSNNRPAANQPVPNEATQQPGSSGLCSGEPSLDSSSPDFVPSLFLNQEPKQNPEDKLEREERREERINPALDQRSPSPSPQQHSSLELHTDEEDLIQKPDEFSVLVGGRCCVSQCRRRSHDHRGRKIPNGLTFHCFPSWRTHEGRLVCELTSRRRRAWVEAVGRGDITFYHIPPAMRVCSRHFNSGKPAYEKLEGDRDWVPSLLLGHSDDVRKLQTKPLPPIELQTKPLPPIELQTNPRLPKAPTKKDRHKRRRTEEKQKKKTEQTEACDWSRSPQSGSEAKAGPVKQTVPWKDVKPLVESELKHQTNRQQDKKTRKKMDASFRDFFRKALESSLEASSRSRVRPDRQQTEMSFRLPRLEEPGCIPELPCPAQAPVCGVDSSSRAPGSSCVNCVHLQNRISELQERLESHQTEAEETEETEWMEPLSPRLTEVETESDSNSNSKVFRSTENRLRRTPRFRQSWLKMFPFLRYSPSQDVMWCHVCRLHEKKSRHHMALIRGSRVFKIHSIKKHSDSLYHLSNVQRHRATGQDKRETRT